MTDNPYGPPDSDISTSDIPEMRYVGFWARTAAAIIDTILLMFIILPLMFVIYGSEFLLSDNFIEGPADFLLNYIMPAIVVIVFWRYKSATPGKMVVNAQIVDARTGRPASTGQLIGRYLGYYVSMIPLLLGIFWVAWDPRKQGWHDKLAKTVVIKRNPNIG